LYAVAHPGILLPMQTTGFTAIGSGGTHGAVRLSLGNQAPAIHLPETIYNVYEAKRASEVAPGVGQLTDMTVLTKKGVAPLSDAHLKELMAFHKKEPGLKAAELATLREICKEYDDDPKS
jgi:hypothetical protein